LQQGSGGLAGSKGGGSRGRELIPGFNQDEVAHLRIQGVIQHVDGTWILAIPEGEGGLLWYQRVDPGISMLREAPMEKMVE
jgi:hypothetical protein